MNDYLKKAIYDSLKITSRSGHRTDHVHEGIVKELKDIVSGFDDKYSVELEKKVTDNVNKSGKFKVDVAISIKEDGKDFLYILVKAFASSVNKNIGNYANNLIGESHRVKFFHPDVNLLFVAIAPNRCPVYNDVGLIRSWENPVYNSLDYAYKIMPEDKVSSCVITYDNDIQDVDCKNDFMARLTLSNIKNIDKTKFTNNVRSIFPS